jgi:predicted membrane-bound spermidine synthase
MVRFLFALSGASALVYEVIWTKRLTLVVGVSTFSLSIVLAAFLCGLALGSLLFGRKAAQWSRPLRAYAALELGVAAGALALHLVLPGLESAYAGLHRHLGASLAAVRLVRIVICFLALLPPTLLMGGTLPILCQREVARGETLPASLAGLYAVNTLGGAAGTLLAGFVLIERLGLTGTLLVAVLLNLLAAAAAWTLDAAEAGGAPGRDHPGRSGEMPRGGRSPGEAGALDRRGRAVLLGVFALSGFAALSFEILWTRSLNIFLRSGFVYSFTLMLATFLLGIVLGSWIFHRFLDPRGVAGLLGFAALEIAVGAWGLLSIPLLTRAASLPEAVSKSLGSGEYSWGEWTLAWIFASVMVLIVPSTLMGILFPLAGRLFVIPARAGSGVGALYAANTAGCVAGAAVTGFLLIPRFGTLESLRLISILNLACAALPLLAVRGAGGARRSRRALALSAAALVALGGLLLPSGLIRSRIIASRPGRNLLFAEGAAGLVEVYERRGVEGNSYRKLYFNGTSYAGTTQSGRRYHRLLGHLPALLHPRPRTGLVIGFGSGMTFGAMMLDARIERVDCAELSPEVLRAGSLFARDNGGARDDPKGRIILGDGREHLLITTERYDLITLEPPPPRFAGVVNLYSEDFYRLCRSRIRNGGLMAQWIPMHSHSVPEMRNLVRSFLEVFPEATFWAPTPRDGILVGSVAPVPVSAAELRARMAAPRVAADLASIDVPDLGALLGSLLLDAPALAAYVRDARSITDDRPTIEYFAAFDLVEHPGHLEDVLRNGINPARWLEAAGGGAPLSLSAAEVRHLQAMQRLLLGAVAGDRGDLEGKRREYAAALGLHPESIFLRRLNRVGPGGDD